jgi:tetratricopeptide (TPR) repeat protein
MRLALASLIFACFATSAMAQDASQDTSTATTTIPAVKQDPEQLRENRLDTLLGQLHKAGKSEDTSAIQKEIQEIWTRDKSATAEVLLQESTVAMSAGDYDPAEKMLSQLLETYPKFAAGWQHRAFLYHEIGRPDAALVDIDHALTLEPRDYVGYALKGIILVDLNRSDEAIAAFRQALAINPNLPAVEAGIKKIEKDEPHV